jgi:hypothetical protein
VFCYRHYNDINSSIDEQVGDNTDLDISFNGFEVSNRNIEELNQLYFHNFTGNLMPIRDEQKND